MPFSFHFPERNPKLRDFSNLTKITQEMVEWGFNPHQISKPVNIKMAKLSENYETLNANSPFPLVENFCLGTTGLAEKWFQRADC